MWPGIVLGVIVGCCASSALAADLVNGRNARFRNGDGVERDSATIKFDREIQIAAPLPDPLCPATSSVTIISDRHAIGPIELDCTAWEARRYGFLYRDRDGTAGGVEKIQFQTGSRGGRLSLRLGGPGYGIVAVDGPVAFVEVRLTVAGTSYCGRFESPPSIIDPNASDSVRIKGPSLPCTSAPMPTPTPVIVEECRSAGFCVTVPPGEDMWNQVGSAADVQGACDNDFVATTALSSNGHTTEYLDCSNFGFTVPDGSTILGITTRWTRGKSNVDRPVVDLESRLLKNASRVGTNHAETSTTWCRNCLSTATYGGASDLWGETWTPAEVRSSSFGAALRGQRLAGGSGNLYAAVDCTQMCVRYASGPTPPATTTATPTATPTATATGGATRTPTTPPTGVLDRPADPVVMTGADLPWLTGVAPNTIVGFRYQGAWEQVPVQIDERANVSFDALYNGLAGYGGGFVRLDYTDAGTHAGADPDVNFDSNDELVFMARDTGEATVGTNEPAGVVVGSGVQVQVVDPLGGVGYLYLFRHDGSLSPGAGRTYVTYSFSLLSGDYLASYGFAAGPNPEDSTITTDKYAVHFSDRWVRDETRILAGAASGVDILDRHKALFGPTICTRSEDSFSNGEGAFVINKSGPVRAIRSYIGANSGPRTQRQHYFYDQREDVVTFLRVHSVPGIMDFFDYSPAASGMVYRNQNHLGGSIIDGVPDGLTGGLFDWELVTGLQGSLTHVLDPQADFTITNGQLYYLDAAAPATVQCTGDASAFGSSGSWVNERVPNTDPVVAPVSTLTSVRVMYFDPPGLGVADAAQRRDWVFQPLSTSATPW